MPYCAIIVNRLKKRLDQDGYSSRSRRTSLRRRVFSFSTSPCGHRHCHSDQWRSNSIIRSSCSLSGHCYAMPCWATDVAERICSASTAQPPNLMKAGPPLSSILRINCWAVVNPLVVAIRTASPRNSSVYLFAIPYLLHSKHCSKETGTKPRQVHFVSIIPFAKGKLFPN